MSVKKSPLQPDLVGLGMECMVAVAGSQHGGLTFLILTRVSQMWFAALSELTAKTNVGYMS